MKILSLIADIVLIIALCVFLYLQLKPSSKAGVTLGTVRQDTVLQPVSETNTPAFLASNLNQYLTNPGWISQSNSRIYAGLGERVWSTDYGFIMEENRNLVSLWVGQGVGVSYQFRVWSGLTVGGMGVWSGGEFGVYGGLGWGW